MAALEYETGLILDMDIVTGNDPEINFKSNLMEKVLLQRMMSKLRSSGLKITEIVTDASSTFISYFGRLR